MRKFFGLLVILLSVRGGAANVLPSLVLVSSPDSVVYVNQSLLKAIGDSQLKQRLENEFLHFAISEIQVGAPEATKLNGQSMIVRPFSAKLLAQKVKGQRELFYFRGHIEIKDGPDGREGKVVQSSVVHNSFDMNFAFSDSEIDYWEFLDAVAVPVLGSTLKDNIRSFGW